MRSSSGMNRPIHTRIPRTTRTRSASWATSAPISGVSGARGNLVWIGRFIPLEDLIHLYASATVFVCPSVYEPFGLVNLEAMACETAVVASRVGGIPEIVVEGESGYLVDYALEDVEGFIAALAARVDELLSDPPLAARMGKAGRERVLGRL